MRLRAISSNGVDWDHYLQLVSRQKWFVLVPAALGVCALTGLSLREPDQYKATATMLVEPQSLPPAILRSTLPYGPETYVRTLVEQIKSPTRLTRVIDQFSLYPALRARRPLEEVAAFMGSHIEVERRGPDTFSVSFIGDDPDKVQAVTNCLTDIFIQENTDFRLSRVARNVAFLKGQSDDLRAQVSEQERRIQQFKSEHLDRLPEQRAPLETQLSASQERLQSVTESLLSTRVKLASAQDRIAMLRDDRRLEAGSTQDQEAASPEQRLAKAQAELIALRSSYSDQHPDVRLKRQELELLSKQLASERASSPAGSARSRPGPIAPDLLRAYEEQRLAQEDIARLTDQQTRLEKEIASLSQRIDDIPSVELDLSQLTSGLDVLREQADSFQNKATEAAAALELEKASQGSQFRALDRAGRPTRPVSPNRPMWALLGAFAGGTTGLTIIILLDLIFRPFFKEEDLALFSDVQILVSIPHVGRLPSEWQRVVRQLLSLVDLLRSASPLGAVPSFPGGTYRLPEPASSSIEMRGRAAPAMAAQARGFTYLVGAPILGDHGPDVRVPFQTDDETLWDSLGGPRVDRDESPFLEAVPGATLPPGTRGYRALAEPRVPAARRSPGFVAPPASEATPPTEPAAAASASSPPGSSASSRLNLPRLDNSPDGRDSSLRGNEARDASIFPEPQAVPGDQGSFRPLAVLLSQLEHMVETLEHPLERIGPRTSVSVPADSGKAADVHIGPGADSTVGRRHDPTAAGVQSGIGKGLAPASEPAQRIHAGAPEGRIQSVPVSVLSRKLAATAMRIVSPEQPALRSPGSAACSEEAAPPAGVAPAGTAPRVDMKRYSILTPSLFSRARQLQETTKELGRRAPWADAGRSSSG